MLAEDPAREAIAFRYAFAGLGGGKPYLHPDMLAVRLAARGRGLGGGSSERRREEALRRGLRLVQWTFDPMRARNARLSPRHLGGSTGPPSIGHAPGFGRPARPVHYGQAAVFLPLEPGDNDLAILVSDSLGGRG